MTTPANFIEGGATLGGPRSCRLCASAVRVFDRFCPQCGTRLRPLSLCLPSTESLASSLGTESPGERRQVTVLFCDVIGSTLLSTRSDPEVTRRVMQVYQSVCAAVIVRYEGHIAQTLGDGLLVYFGYPRAHEDDAERAVHAALEITARISDARGPFRQIWNTGAVRVGISTGVVVVGAFSEWDTRAAMAVVGETPNLASRYQHLAGRNEVVIGAETKSLVEGHFRFEARGPFDIAGVRTPIQLFRVLEKPMPSTRFRARQTSTSGEMVGRGDELTMLLERWHRARHGMAQAVVITGPAGVGKSRLAHALGIVAQQERAFELSVQCSSYFTNTALYPVAVQLRRAASIRANDSPNVVRAKLDRILRLGEPASTQHAALLAHLLQVADSLAGLDAMLGPERILSETVDALVKRVEQLAARRAVLVLLEDAHWVDPTTLKLVQRLLKSARNQRIMLLITDRDPPGTRNYGPSALVDYVPLERLGVDACRALVRRIASGKLSESITDVIIARSEGLPLYAEELTKAAIDDATAHAKGSVPPTLQALLTERIDRSGGAKVIAQIGACIVSVHSPS